MEISQNSNQGASLTKNGIITKKLNFNKIEKNALKQKKIKPAEIKWIHQEVTIAKSKAKP